MPIPPSTLTITNDVSRYTRAAALSKVGKKTEAFLRFSTVAGERGAADAERDVRGFALQALVERLGRDDPEAVQFTGIYHNLIRCWAEV